MPKSKKPPANQAQGTAHPPGHNITVTPAPVPVTGHILVNQKSGASYQFTPCGEKGATEIEINFIDTSVNHTVVVPRAEAVELWRALLTKGYKKEG